jgi:phycobilisome rod-core linker protein
MSIPLLEYAPLSQNHRVNGFEVGSDEQPRIYTTENILDSTELDILIAVAYRQIYNEQQMLTSHRQRFLESQLRAGQITVRDFIRGLVLSDSFRRLTFESNNNYRFVEICIQRVLGRSPYSDREKIAWSAVVMTRGIAGFVEDLLNSEEYLSVFGDNVVPYQRRRILPQHTVGELPFARMARYGIDYRNKLPLPTIISGTGKGSARLDFTLWAWQKNPPQVLEKTWIGLFYGGMSVIVFLFLATLLGF